MPWFPDFVGAVELVREQARAAGHVDPVGQYVTALSRGDVSTLETAWPGHVVVHDPRVGEVRGHRQVRRFVQRSQSFLAEHQVRTETMASTVVGSRAVVELLARVVVNGREGMWPVGVVAETPNDRSVVFRSYFSRWLFDGQRHVRPAFLEPERVDPADVVGRYRAALDAGDTDEVVCTFTPEGYYREPIGPPFAHRGACELRSFFERCFSEGGGIGLQTCCVTDDGVRCALEYNCVRWGRHALPPQAGLAVFERGPGGLLLAVRVYDDVAAPLGGA
jgi:limonene-1,2-epoxide hydrolase